MRRRDFCLGSLPASLAARTLSPPAGPLRPVAFENIRVAGDIARRAAQNYDRLESPIYRPPALFTSQSVKAWPGDWEGRALLGVTLLERSTHREAKYRGEILAQFPAHMNRQGYFGPPLDLKSINEQQLSGNGWVLRGLCESCEARRDDRTLGMLEKVTKNLILPTAGQHATYPIDPAARRHGGGESGTITAQLGNWNLSSDIGCEFIFLDGVTHAYKVLPSPQLKAVADEMIARFLQIDLFRIKAQTHASLTALRALLRYSEITDDARLLSAAEERYKLYRTVAMTENYENHNWFGRPEWTEGCAVLDSFIVATQLWQRTGNPAYLEDAHLIYFNGMGRLERNNGGYGTDTCSGARDPFVAIGSYEAFWCCTMRGGEGHARTIEYSYFSRPGELVVPFFQDSTATVRIGPGALSLRQSTGYPYRGAVTLDVVASSVKDPVRVRFAAPSWTSAHRLEHRGKTVKTAVREGFVEARLPLAAGDALKLEFDLRVGAQKTHNPNSIRGYHAFLAGPLMLGADTATEIHLPRDARLTAEGPGRFRVAGRDVRLSRINDVNELQLAGEDKCRRQVLFCEG